MCLTNLHEAIEFLSIYMQTDTCWGGMKFLQVQKLNVLAYLGSLQNYLTWLYTPDIYLLIYIPHMIFFFQNKKALKN